MLPSPLLVEVGLVQGGNPIQDPGDISFAMDDSRMAFLPNVFIGNLSKCLFRDDTTIIFMNSGINWITSKPYYQTTSQSCEDAVGLRLHCLTVS